MNSLWGGALAQAIETCSPTRQTSVIRAIQAAIRK
jgi:hypothetical protein